MMPIKQQQELGRKRRELQLADGVHEETNFKRRRIIIADVLLQAELADHNPFDHLCDDVVLCILQSLSCGARSPSDLIAVSLTCKRFRELATQRSVLASASSGAVAVKASAWCQHAHDFVQRCADCGNVEACFTLGMIKFYCMEERREGIRLLLKAAMAWHGAALFALAIIQFNGSGGKAKDKNARAGVALCVRAAAAGSVEATRELGHCLKEGHGVLKDTMGGRRLLLEANRKEAMKFIHARRTRGSCGPKVMGGAAHCCRQRRLVVCKEHLRRCLVADSGCAFPVAWVVENTHPAHVFLADWFADGRPSSAVGLRVCWNAVCGRPETRPFEYRQCSTCSSAFYCSRSCQSMDWKLRHMLLCRPSLPSLV